MQLLQKLTGKYFMEGYDNMINDTAACKKVDSVLIALQNSAMLETGYAAAFRQIFSGIIQPSLPQMDILEKMADVAC